MSDSLNCGDGWVFCSKAEAEEWYDFYARRWKLMSAAGRHDYGAAYRKRDWTPKITKVEVSPHGNGYVAYLYWSNFLIDAYAPKKQIYRLSHNAIDIIDAVEEVLMRFANAEERTIGSLEGTFQDGIFILRD